LERKKKQEEEAKKRAKQEELAKEKRKKEEEAKRRAKEERIRKEREKKQRANSLFNSIETPKPSQSSHTATPTNQNQATHQSGRVSDKNREKGVENAYIAKIQRQLRNWPAQSNYQGDQVRINFTIYNSGKFKFRITRRSANPDFNSGITQYLKQLQRIGFGTHSKSTPYDIDVNFKAR
jgi:outer membrane biosynthesis protein TonB